MIRIGEKSLYYHPIYADAKPRFVEEDELPMFLSDTVKLDKTVTFERVFKLIIMHNELFNMIFKVGCLGGYKIDQYIDEFMKFDDDKDPDSMDYLEVYWHSEYWNFDYKELSCYPAFHGIKENYTDEHQKEPCRMNMGLDFTSINNLRKYKIKLNENVRYHDYIKKAETIEEKYPLLVEGNTEFRLFDLIQAILNDISFYGSPEQRDAKAKELDETVKRIESGEEKTYEMKIEDGKFNFYDTETGDLHDSWDDPDEDDDSLDCGCNGLCDCDD